MEKLEKNLRLLLTAEHKSVFDLATKVVEGLEGKDELKTPEIKTAHKLFDCIWKFSESRIDINRALNQLIGTAQLEQKRLEQGVTLDLGWLNTTRYEETVNESKKLWNEVHSLAYIAGLTTLEITLLQNVIHSLTEYRK